MEESQEKKFDWNTIWKWLKNPTVIAIILGLLFFVTLAMPLFEAHAVTVNVTSSVVEIFETPDTDKYNVFANLLFRGFGNWPILALYILGVIGLALSAFGLKWRKCLMVSALLYMVTGVMFLISNEMFNLGEAWIDLASLGFADYVYDYIAVCDASLNAGSVIAAIMCFLTAIVAFKAASLTDEFTISDMTEMSYWSATSNNTFADARKDWRKALIYHTQQALKTPAQKNSFMPLIWQAFAIYTQIDPSDKEIAELLPQIDAYFMTLPRYMRDVEDYTWDMIAANQRYQTTRQLSFVNFAARQTTRLLEDMYTQHDTGINSCSLSLGLVEASLILTGRTGDYARIEQTALGRSQLEYYSSLKYTILPNQTWITLGPGRTLHSQDFKRFAGASVFGMHLPRTNIGLVELCLLTGMRFSNEDIKELKQGKDKE